MSHPGTVVLKVRRKGELQPPASFPEPGAWADSLSQSFPGPALGSPTSYLASQDFSPSSEPSLQVLPHPNTAPDQPPSHNLKTPITSTLVVQATTLATTPAPQRPIFQSVDRDVEELQPIASQTSSSPLVLQQPRKVILIILWRMRGLPGRIIAMPSVMSGISSPKERGQLF